MTVKLLTEQYLEFLSLTGGCTGSSESIRVKIPHCWKLHVTAQIWSVEYELVRILLIGADTVTIVDTYIVLDIENYICMIWTNMTQWLV